MLLNYQIFDKILQLQKFKIEECQFILDFENSLYLQKMNMEWGKDFENLLLFKPWF